MSNLIYQEQTPRQIKYQNHYNRLIIRGQNRATSRKEANKILDGYCEEHHIIPTCMDGNNSKSNKVYLTAREHYVAHLLLVLIYPNQQGLAYAAHMMCVDRYGHRTNNRDYEWLKKKNSIEQSLRQTGRTKETHDGHKRQSEKTLGIPKPGVTAALLGRRKETHEYLMNISKKLSNRSKNTHEYLRQRSEYQTGQTKETCERVAKMAASKTLLNKDNCEGIRQQIEKMTGRRKENDDGCRKISETISILTKEERIELVTLRDSGMQLKQIHKLFNERGISIAYSTISNTYQRVKKEMIKNDYYNRISVNT